MREHAYIVAFLTTLRAKYKKNSWMWRTLASVVWLFQDERYECEYCGALFLNEAEWYLHRVMHISMFGGNEEVK
jgi:hypothetical protein